MATLVPAERAVVERLAEKIRELTFNGRALSYAELDRRIGKGTQGWTRKFLAGPDSTLFPGTPSIGTLIEVLRVLNVPVGEFFEEALADQPRAAAQVVGPSDAELLTALAEAVRKFQTRIEQQEERIELLERKEKS
jgi:transcriptional regulator with XRE-family HTH domain